MQNTQQIDLGADGWKIDAAPGFTFGSRERAIAYASENKLTGEPVHVDTRPTIREVLTKLCELENERTGASENATRYGCAGPWDEYFSSGVDAAGSIGRDERWPAGYYWIAVYVVVGGSEGLYLHVDAIGKDNARRNLILGKTCAGGRDTWFRCYESAAHISYLLNN